MMPIFPAEGAGYASGYGQPVFAFEMATSTAGLQKVFGDLDDPERPGRIAAMDRGNRWDYLFMFVYGGFVCTYFVAVARQTDRKLWWLIASLGIFAAFSDGVENAILLGITPNIEAVTNLSLLAYPVWIKFLSLMVAGIAAGVHLCVQPQTVWKVLGIVAAVGVLPVLAAFYAPDRFGYLVGNGITITWVIQLFYAITQSIRRPAKSLSRSV